jgi:prevent-host-death family protein
MNIPAAEFKARCLALIDQVHERGEAVTITKRGRVVAALVPAGREEEQPWTRVRGKARWHGDPFAPVVDDDTSTPCDESAARYARLGLVGRPSRQAWQRCQRPFSVTRRTA